MSEPHFELEKLPSIAPQKQKKLSDSVYEILSDYIVTGKLPPGQRLREAEVARSLEVSRTPVREAFARLEMRHLLERDPTGASLVATWDERILWEVATLRDALEGLAVSLACTNLAPADYDYLASLILRMDGAYRRDDRARLIDLDIAFHSHIWARSGHGLLTRQLEEMKEQVRHFMYLTLPGDEKDYAASHQELLDVLRQGHADTAVRAIQDHILLTVERRAGRLQADHLTALVPGENS